MSPVPWLETTVLGCSLKLLKDFFFLFEDIFVAASGNKILNISNNVFSAVTECIDIVGV